MLCGGAFAVSGFGCVVSLIWCCQCSRVFVSVRLLWVLSGVRLGLFGGLLWADIAFFVDGGCVGWVALRFVGWLTILCLFWCWVYGLEFGLCGL